jgi:putative Holliday junction resolvase
MRLLSIDYGEKRIGLAITDEMEITVRPLSVIQRKNRRHDMKVLGEVLEEYGVERIIVGYPVSLDGARGPACEKIDRFIHRMEKMFSMDIVRQDETLSSREAEEILRETRKNPRKQRQMLDSLAACLILERYLENRRRQNSSGKS